MAPSLKSACTRSRTGRTSASCSGSLTSQLRCGSSRSRAPFAPPRLSVVRNVAADAHAVVTSWLIESPESSSVAFRDATSASSTSSWSTAGTGSCHSWGSATHGPRNRETGPMSRCRSLYQALANASRNASLSSWKRREIFS